MIYMLYNIVKSRCQKDVGEIWGSARSSHSSWRDHAGGSRTASTSGRTPAASVPHLARSHRAHAHRSAFVESHTHTRAAPRTPTSSSLLGAGFAYLAESVAVADAVGIDEPHSDLIDWCLVPSMRSGALDATELVKPAISAAREGGAELVGDGLRFRHSHINLIVLDMSAESSNNVSLKQPTLPRSLPREADLCALCCEPGTSGPATHLDHAGFFHWR